ncbi:MAG: hypothetical protein JJT76_18550 [Clostridiaceae bacterium]|nr:hypothetical protein [Clostridiaceae bacterium]
MKDFRQLKILDKFQFFYKKLGVNYNIMRKILQIKLLMDQRRIPTVVMEGSDQQDENMFKKSLLMYGFMGLVIMLFILPDFPLFFKMNIVYAMMLFMVMTVMIADFSSVLLDIQEKNILLPKPIDNRTISAAKTTHILLYLMTITMTIAAPAFIAGIFKHGLLFGGIFFLQLFLLSGFIILFTSLLYFLILLFFDGEKLKDIINYFQIFLSVGMILVYQLLGRVFQIVDYDTIFTPRWWSYFIPPLWFAAPFSILLENQYTPQYIYLSILGVILPLVVLVFYFKVVAPHFEKNLQKLQQSNRKKTYLLERRVRLHKKIADLFSSNAIESTFFRFTQNMINNERNLKLKLYPNLAFAVIMPLITLMANFGGNRSFEEVMEEIVSGRYYLFIYGTITLLVTSIPMLAAADGYRAAWIYRTLPIRNYRSIYKGALKGFVVKLILPSYLFVSLIFLMIYGFGILPDILLMFFNMILLIIVIFHLSSKHLPFSQDFASAKYSTIGVLFGGGGFAGASAATHGFFISRNISVLPYIILVILMIFILWRIAFKSIEKLA